MKDICNRIQIVQTEAQAILSGRPKKDRSESRERKEQGTM